MKRFKARQTYLLFILILSVFLITGCGGGGGEGTSGHWLPSNANTPTVTSTVPTDVTTGVCVNKVITATFSKAMNASTITAAGTFTVKETVTGNNVPGVVAYNAITKTATFTPTVTFTPGLNYTATITTAAKDMEGNALAADKVWSFTADATICAMPIPPIPGGILDPFAIASAGGITNTGATKINGDVVLDPNFFCNDEDVGTGNDFGPCGSAPPTNNVGDLVITPTYPDTTTAHAVMAALLAKWNSLMKANLPGATVLGCGTIGSTGDAGAGIGCSGNFTLPPGVYISLTDSSIGVAGDLTLDGQGDSNAVFVFQAPSSTVITAAGPPPPALGHTRILLINGTKASNVWWQVGSSATLGTNTEFQGNILASASITMETGSRSCGRLLSGAEGSGAFTFDSNVSVSVPGHPNAPVGCE